MLVFACRQLEISLVSYLRYVFFRTFLGGLAVLVVLLWFRIGLDVHGLVGLAVAGLGSVIVFGVIWRFFVYKNDPYVKIDWRLIRQLRVKRA